MTNVGFSEFKVTSSDVSLCSTNSLKLKEIQSLMNIYRPSEVFKVPVGLIIDVSADVNRFIY